MVIDLFTLFTNHIVTDMVNSYTFTMRIIMNATAVIIYFIFRFFNYFKITKNVIYFYIFNKNLLSTKTSEDVFTLPPMIGQSK